MESLNIQPVDPGASHGEIWFVTAVLTVHVSQQEKKSRTEEMLLKMLSAFSEFVQGGTKNQL